MTTLEEAWQWYRAVKFRFKLTTRLASRYWDSLPWNGEMGRDVVLRDVKPDQLVLEAKPLSDELDDLAVVVLFSVFEAAVREYVIADVTPEVDRLRHPALKHAARDVCTGIQEGSFFRVLEPFKMGGHADLVEQVNQVRRYRNWVAHGRRGKPPAAVDPVAAYERLTRFLTVLQSAPSDSQEQTAPPTAET